MKILKICEMRVPMPRKFAGKSNLIPIYINSWISYSKHRNYDFKQQKFLPTSIRFYDTSACSYLADSYVWHQSTKKLRITTTSAANIRFCWANKLRIISLGLYQCNVKCHWFIHQIENNKKLFWLTGCNRACYPGFSISEKQEYIYNWNKGNWVTKHKRQSKTLKLTLTF